MIEKESVFDIICKKPTEQEYLALSQIKLTNGTFKSAAQSDKKISLKMSIVFFGIFGIFVIITGLYYLIMESKIDIFMDGTLAFIGILIKYNPLLIIIPIGFALSFFIIAISLLKKGFSTTLQKSPISLFKNFFLEYFCGYGHDSTTIAFKQLSKLIPEEILEPQKMIKANLEKFIKIMQEDKRKALSEIEKEYKINFYEEGDSLLESPIIKSNIIINDTKELYKNIFEINATVSKTVKWINSHHGAITDTSSDFASYTYQLNICCVLIQSGKYWFAYDLISDIKQKSV